MTLSELRAARKRLGMTQNGLAKALRLGEFGGRTVRGWELGERDIPGPAQVAIELMVEKAEAIGGWRARGLGTIAGTGDA